MNGVNAIRYHHRPSGERREEAIYGEKWLRWAYENPLGRAVTWALAARAFFSRWYGWRMRQPSSRKRIQPFVTQYDVDMGEAAQPLEAYASFNDFFTRKLKPEARPIAPAPEAVVFPADARHFGWADGDAPVPLFAKGQSFDLPALLGDAALATQFAGGSTLVSRLCPVDYHRFHVCTAGSITQQITLPGPLYSVSPLALQRRLAIWWTNRRGITLLETAHGPVAHIAIGATNVGSIVHTATTGQALAKGDELGYFQFGGSCVITLFAPGTVTLAADLLAVTQQGEELWAPMGDVLGAWV